MIMHYEDANEFFRIRDQATQILIYAPNLPLGSIEKSFKEQGHWTTPIRYRLRVLDRGHLMESLRSDYGHRGGIFIILYVIGAALAIPVFLVTSGFGMRELNKENATIEKAQDGHRPFAMKRCPLLDMKDRFFSYILPKLKELLEPKRRRLFLEDGSKVLRYMLAPQQSDLQTINFGTFPAIESLAFVALDLAKEQTRRRPRQEYADNDYNRLGNF